jgi:hypothetical protein
MRAGVLGLLIFATGIGIPGELLGNPVGGQPGDEAKRLVGTWRLVSIATGTVRHNRGERPTGLLHYDDNGYMSVQIMPSRSRSKWSNGGPTPDEAKDSLGGYTAYFGRYTIDENKDLVVHHRMGNIRPGAFGKIVRRYEFLSEDTLLLTPVESKTRLIWARVK